MRLVTHASQHHYRLASTSRFSWPCSLDIDQWSKVTQVLGTPPPEFFKQLQQTVCVCVCGWVGGWVGECACVCACCVCVHAVCVCTCMFCMITKSFPHFWIHLCLLLSFFSRFTLPSPPRFAHTVRVYLGTLARAGWSYFQMSHFQMKLKTTESRVSPWRQTYMYTWTINEPHLPYKTGLDVMQSHPLCRTRFSQYQASSAVLGWPGDGDCYNIMRRMQSGSWPYSKSCMHITSGSLIVHAHACLIVGFCYKEDNTEHCLAYLGRAWASPT